MAEDDPRATNSPEDPERVVPRTNSSPTIVSPGSLKLEVAPISWTLLSINGHVVDVFAAAST